VVNYRQNYRDFENACSARRGRKAKERERKKECVRESASVQGRRKERDKTMSDNYKKSA